MFSKSILIDQTSQILSSIQNNQITIVSASTGSGKSTIIPQIILDSGLGWNVLVSEPRRVAAISLCTYVRGQRKDPGSVGYYTFLDQSYDESTRLLYTTGSIKHCKRFLAGSKPCVLIIDEIHEWHLNTEVLLMWAKHELETRGLERLVIMSAEIDESLPTYFEGLKVNVLKFESQIYPVTAWQVRSHDMNDLWKLACEYDRENILIFLPGKKEIDWAILNLRQNIPTAKILPLYSDMSLYSQQKVFQTYDTQKIVVATNIAQTSITIPDIDIVIDSGLEKFPSWKNGVKSLELVNVSKCDLHQRRGRVGRTKPGIYILGSTVGEEARQVKNIPHIYRMPLYNSILELMRLGITTFEKKFFHDVSSEDIQEAQSYLECLGILDEDRQLTQIGYRLGGMSYGLSISLGALLSELLNASTEDVLLVEAILAYEKTFISPQITSLGDPRLMSSDELVECHNSDLLALLTIYKNCLNGRIPSSSELINWNTFRNIDRLYGSLKASFKSQIAFKKGDGDPKKVLMCSLGWMLDNIMMYDSAAYTYTHLKSGISNIHLVNDSICEQDDVFLIASLQRYLGTSSSPIYSAWNGSVVSGDDLTKIFPYAVRYGDAYESKKYRNHLEIPIFIKDVWCTSKYVKVSDEYDLGKFTPNPLARRL